MHEAAVRILSRGRQPGRSCELADSTGGTIHSSVSDEEARRRYPQGFKASKPYLRTVPQPRA
jgi:hypothetical protein